jgi:hypothetical protein
MKVDFLPAEAWVSMNEKVQRFLQVSEDHQLRCYPGVAAAAYEVAMGATQFYSHKRSVGVVSGHTHVFQNVLPYLYKEGYQVQFFDSQKSGVPDIAAWVDSLRKDTNFVFLAEDHPITGEHFDWDELDQRLNEKRIYAVRISHHRHFYQPSAVRPYSVQVRSYGPDVAIGILGNRFKAPPLMTQSLSWKRDAFFEGLQFSLRHHKEDKKLIQEFEKDLPSPFKAFFSHERRSFDRSVFYTTEINGDALRQFLLAQVKISQKEPGWEENVETTCLCRWGGTRSYEDWWIPRPADEVLRGMMVIGVDFLAKAEVRAILELSVEHCRI